MSSLNPIQCRFTALRIRTCKGRARWCRTWVEPLFEAELNLVSAPMPNEENVMNWMQMIDHCFGLKDRPFAQHPSDEETAFDLLMILRSKHIGWAEFERQLRRRLDTMPKLDTDEEVRRVRGYFRIWLLD
jgi:hypothetical protein